MVVQSEHGWVDRGRTPAQVGIGFGQTWSSLSTSYVVIVGEAVQPFMKISQSQYPPLLPNLRSSAVALGARRSRHRAAQRSLQSHP